MPHSKLSVPLKQLLPMQHPAQFCGPQGACVWQTLPWHDAPGRHFMHCSPPNPHAPSAVPVTHVLPWQHPPQFWGVHCGI
jgi:hypothetical protein